MTSVPIPLPGGFADELLWHLQNCNTCKAAKVHLAPNYCTRGRQLIQLTTAERHGPRDDER